MERVLAYTGKHYLFIECYCSFIVIKYFWKSFRRLIFTTFALLSRKSPENMAFITSHRAVSIALWAGTLPSSSSNITSANSPKRNHILSSKMRKNYFKLIFNIIRLQMFCLLYFINTVPCSRQMSSKRCLTTCLYLLLRSLLNWSLVCKVPSTINNCGSSKNSAACLISYMWNKEEWIDIPM